MRSLVTVSDYKNYILEVLRRPKEEEPSGARYVVSIDMVGPSLAYFDPIGPQRAGGFVPLKYVPGIDPKLFREAARTLESEGVLVEYQAFHYESAGVTLRYVVGIPEREHEFMHSSRPHRAA